MPEYTLSMVFLTETGDKRTISISKVKANITQLEVDNLMNILIGHDIFMSKYGDLQGAYSAKLTERTVTKYEV